MKEKLTFTQAVELFRKHWNTIADMTPEEMKKCGCVMDIKRRALEKIGIDDNVCHCCFCCEYTNMRCNLCPIEWSGSHARCSTPSGEYSRFACAINYEEYEQAVVIARKIANLPAREMIESEE